MDTLANWESTDGNYQRSLELHDEAIALARGARNVTASRAYRHNRACTLRLMGRLDEAQAEMTSLIPDVLRQLSPGELIVVAEDFGAVLAEIGHHHAAIQLLGAADAQRDRMQEADIRDAFEAARSAMPKGQWDVAYATGQHSLIEAVLRVHVRE